jgi:hypothetical protein
VQKSYGMLNRSPDAGLLTAAPLADQPDDAQGAEEPVEGGEPTYRAAEVVRALYESLLNRPADVAGLAHHVGLLAKGANLADVVGGIANSSERTEALLRAGGLAAAAHSAWEATRPGERPLFFLHIMKTGGTALLEGMNKVAGDRVLLAQMFLDHLVVAPPVVAQRASLVAGHLGAEALDLLAPETETATVVREPLTRALSHWAHVRRDPALLGEASNLSLEDFVFSPRWRPLCENFQARNLVHRVGIARAWHDYSPVRRLAALGLQAGAGAAALPLQCLFELGPMEVDLPTLTATAIARLDAIEYVGVTERLHDIYRVLAARWGVADPPPLARANVSAKRPEPADVPVRLRDAILEANLADMALYERARQRASQLAERGGQA